MLTIENRPMTEAERQVLLSYVAQPVPRDGCFDGAVRWFICLVGGFVFGSMVAVLPGVAWDFAAKHLQWAPISNTAGIEMMGVGGLAGFALGARSLYRDAHRIQNSYNQAQQAYMQDLQAGFMEIWHCTVSRATELEEFEDEGTGFFLELGPKQTLFLQGQYLYDYKDRSFPCGKFDLAYAPVSRHLAEIACLDEPFQDWPVHPPILNWEEWKDWPSDGEILPISLDTLDADLELWATRQE